MNEQMKEQQQQQRRYQIYYQQNLVKWRQCNHDKLNYLIEILLSVIDLKCASITKQFLVLHIMIKILGASQHQKMPIANFIIVKIQTIAHLAGSVQAHAKARFVFYFFVIKKSLKL